MNKLNHHLLQNIAVGSLRAVVVLWLGLTLSVQAAMVDKSAFLFTLNSPAAAVAPHHAYDSHIDFTLNEALLDALKVGDQLILPLPDGRVVNTTVVRVKDEIKGRSEHHTVLSIAGGLGSVEFIYHDSHLKKTIITDYKGRIKVHEIQFSDLGGSEVIKQNAHDYFCIDLPNDQHALVDGSGGAPLASQTPSEAQLKVLQSKPNANKVLYINYWGGVLSDTQWNADNNSGNDIVYTAYSYDNDSNTFSNDDRYRMWLAWRETAEDYAPFDVNITTDQTVYDATLSEDRAMLIASTTDSWYPQTAGGLGHLDSFGNDYNGVAWVWNADDDTLGQTISHEAGHMLGLSHDGTNSVEYYLGHGPADDWGPIMGGPFGHKYVQWSKGEYTNANNQEDDLIILKNVLGESPDSVGDAFGTAVQISSSAYVEGVIEPLGLNGGMDTDVYMFQLGSAQNVTINVAPFLGTEFETFGSNLSLDAQLLNSSNVVLASSVLSGLPSTNTLAHSAVLPAGTYYIVITALTPQASWVLGFGEYANGGIYAVNLASSVVEPDLIATETLDDTNVFLEQLLNINAQVQNIGSANAAATTLRFYESTDSTISSADTERASLNVSALSSLSSDFLSTAFPAPNSAGMYWFGVCVDTVVNETVLSNNCSAGTEVVVNATSLDLDIAGAVEAPALVWQRGGDASFFRQTVVSMNAGDAAQSGVIANDESSYIQTEIMGPGWVEFHWKVSSEDTFDYFRFSDNGTEIEAIAGEVDWVKIQHTLAAGTHTLRWEYDKDPFSAGGSDAAWLDKVEVVDREFVIQSFDASQIEGDAGTVAFTYVLKSNGYSTLAASVDYSIEGAGANPADVNDFGGAFPSGTVNFSAGQTLENIVVYVSGDIVFEQDEDFLLSLSNAQGGFIGSVASAQSTILNDELDTDGDNVPDILDNCPLVANPSQINTDLNLLNGDLFGNACDADDDADTILDVNDNCPIDANPNQEDICTFCFPIKNTLGTVSVICL